MPKYVTPKEAGRNLLRQRCHLTKKGVLAAVTKVIPLPRDWVGARNIMLRALQATAVVFQDNAILFPSA